MVLLSVVDVAESLQKSLDWVYRNWKPLSLPFLRVGGELRMRPADFENWLAML